MSTTFDEARPFTYRNGIYEGCYSEGQAAAEHGEDGVAQVVVNRLRQGSPVHEDSGLNHHRPWLGWVLLPGAHGVGLLSVRILGRRSIALRGSGVALRGS